MFRNVLLKSCKGYGKWFRPSYNLIIALLLIALLSACSPAATSQMPTASPSASAATSAPTSTAAGPAKPQGELIMALTGFDNENFLPWIFGLSSSEVCDLVYDLLIYWNEVDRKFIPGLAESWEVSSDAMALTYHLRKGIQFSDGWGEMTSEDVKYNFEMQASKLSTGKVSQTRRIESMDTPDPYTLVVHFKNPYPSFFVDLSLGNSGVCQGIVCKKYVETVGEETASRKPIGTGPVKMVDGKLGDYYKFEALDSHWRVVPEFKYITICNVPEVSTIIAMLKTKEIDLAMVPAEQLADLKTAGLTTEVSPVGGSIIMMGWGGIAIPEDKRYDPAYHNKDPWTDVRVRKAMMISIDREAICKVIYAGGATPQSVPLVSPNMDKFKYPYDLETAKQLLKDAGYPNGFSFKAISYVQPGGQEMPRLIEALAGYWQQIGLNPKITNIELGAYNTSRSQMKTAGEISLFRASQGADPLDKAQMRLMPNGQSIAYESEESYAIYKEGATKISIEEHAVYGDKLNQYYYDNYVGSICRAAACYAWNSEKIAPFPHAFSPTPYYLEYVRHAKPLNTFRLFSPWPDR